MLDTPVGVTVSPFQQGSENTQNMIVLFGFYFQERYQKFHLSEASLCQSVNPNLFLL